MLEFLPTGEAETWRVDKCDLLATEFGLAEPSFATTAEGRPPVDLAVLERRVAEFVFFCQSHPRLWLLVRRLYGIASVIPAADAHPGDLRIWTRAELEAEGFEVKTDLEALRGFWVNHCKREVSGQREDIVRAPAPPEPISPAAATDLLNDLDFSERIFCITVYDPLARMTADGKGGNVPRPEQENRKEREWFLARVIEWEKMLRDSIGGALARSALMNELHLRRMEAEIAVAEPKSRGALYDQQATQTKEYRETVEKLQKMFPELAVAGKVSFKATISDLIRSYLDYYGSADRRLVDKVRTVMEMEYELRTSAQVESRYRFGLNLAIIDNINGLTDPNFMPRFKHRVLKVATAGFRAGAEAARGASREKVVDLENGVLPGEGDDFEDYNDAECPHCGGGVSSQATRCPQCRRQINREVVVPPASPIPPASPLPSASPIPPASPVPPATPVPPPPVYPVYPAEKHGHYVPVEDQFYGGISTSDRMSKMTPRRDLEG